VWGRCVGSGAEPYDCAADHVDPATRCTCPSRIAPCKHVLALLLLWARGGVPATAAPTSVARWIGTRVRAAQGSDRAAEATGPDGALTPADAASPLSGDGTATDPDSSAARSDPGAVVPPVEPDHTTQRDDRIARMSAGLAELDRWLQDRVRTGLADPSLARYATWDQLASRLVDAQVPGLANRVRRLAGSVGASPQWHEHVLAELGALHLLAVAGRHLGSLPPALADSVAVALGWQVRQADVLAGVPVTDRWLVVGRSDTREDRIEVRRTWLRGARTDGWAMVLSFAAYGQSLDTSLPVGGEVEADVLRYPGALGLRVLVGRRYGAPELERGSSVATGSVEAACRSIGVALAVEPWLERIAVTLTAAPCRALSSERWVLGDASGTLPLSVDTDRAGLDTLLACSAGAAVPVTCEWTPRGLVPLTVHLADRHVDVGPTADPTFVSAA